MRATAASMARLARDELAPADLRPGHRVLFRGLYREVLRVERSAKGWVVDFAGVVVDGAGHADPRSVVFGPFAILKVDAAVAA